MERNLPFTSEHEMFRKAVRDFIADEIVPYYEQWEEDHIIPRELYKKMGDYGFLCPWVPEEYGGVGADILFDMIIIEELARKCALQINPNLPLVRSLLPPE